MPVFELTSEAGPPDASGPPGPPDTRTLFGLWMVTGTAVGGPGGGDAPGLPAGLSFGVPTGTGDGDDTDTPIWRARLPHNTAEATARLDTHDRRLYTSRTGLHTATQNIEALVNTSPPPPPPGMLGEAPTPPPLPSPPPGTPEATLVQGLRDINTGIVTMTTTPPHPGVLSGEEEQAIPVESGTWATMCQQAQDTIQRLIQSVSSYARVETEVGGVVVARTAVGWGGDLTTWWMAGVGAEQMRLHNRTLTLTLTSRDTLVRTFVVAAQGAIKLSALVATPGGAVLALPVAWNYINQILERSSRQESGG